MIPRSSSLLPLVASALLFASGAAAQEASRDNWIGTSAGLAKPSLTYLGRVPVVDAEAAPPADALIADGAAAAGARRRAALAGKAKERSSGFVAVDARTGAVHRIDASSDELAMLHQLMVEAGATAASDAAELDSAAESSQAGQGPGMQAEESWSDGINNFVRRGIEDGFPANHDTFRRIGQIGSGCSGTLIGPRHVLTVAHCAVDNVTMQVFQSSFRPRRDGSDSGGPVVQPFGSRSFMTYIFPQEYWNGTCDFLDKRDCNKFDIALGVLDSNFTNLPWMGFGFFQLSSLHSFTKQMRGYPRCEGDDDKDGIITPDAEAPNPCSKFTLYGDSGLCTIGAIGSPDSDNWNRELWVDCDGARGMSGSAMYALDSTLGMAALGAYSQFECTAAACANHAKGEFPNVMTRITPQYAAMISAGKAMFSCPSGSCN
jgi:hypothetical protein